MVARDPEANKPVPINSLLVTNEVEKKFFEEGESIYFLIRKFLNNDIRKCRTKKKKSCG